MKKILVISGLMMAAIVSLTGCQKEQNFIDRSFTVTASTDNGTKTTNDGFSTLWADGDKISVFYKTDDSYSAGITMTLSDGAGTKGGVFAAAAGSAEIPSGTKDWYAIYPSGAKSPASVDKDGGYTYVGNRNGLTQQGYDDTSILSGNSCPMYGVAKDVSGNPAFTMKQLASVIEFNIVNKTDAPVKINKVTLDESESDEAIVGSFYVDFTGEKPEFVKSGDDYVSTKAFTSVANATELAVDATAKVYMPLVPFAHDPMKSFFVLIDGEVNGSAFTSTVALHPTADKCLFEAGKIKRVNVPLEELEEATPPDFTTIAELNTLAADLTTATTFVGKLTDATVSFVPDAKNAFVKDATGSILFYKNDHGLKQGQTYSGNITVSATVYKGLAEVTTWDAAFTGEEAVVAPEEVTLAAIAGDYNKYQSSYVKVANLEVVSVDNKNINVKDGDVNYIVFYNPGDAPIQEGDVITAIGTVTKYNTTEELKVWKSDDIQKAGGDDPGSGPQPEENLAELVITDYVTTNECTVASGSGTQPCYTSLDLSTAVRMSTTGSANCGSFWATTNNEVTTYEWRLYQNKSGNVIITVADGCTLVGVEFTYKISNSGTLKLGENTVESGKMVDCSGSTVEFSVGATKEGEKNGQVRITAVKVKYTGNGTLPPVSEVATLAVNPESVSLNGQASNATVTVTSNNPEWTLDVTSTAQWLTAVKDGSAVKLSATANEGAERSTSFTVKHATDANLVKTITVTQSAGQTNNSVQTVTVAEFLAANEATSLSNAQRYQLTGVITDVVNTTYGNFTLKDDSGSVYVYGLTKTEQELKENNGKVSITNDKSYASLELKAGDTVTLIGYRSSFNETPQVVGAYYVNHVAGDAITTLTFVKTASVAVGETKDIHATVAPEDAVVSYKSSDTGVVTVDATGKITGVAAGSATITATVAAVPGSYTAAEETCAVTVSAQAAQKYEVTVDFRDTISDLPQGSSAGLKDGTYTWSNLEFVLHAAGSFYQNSGYLLIGKKDSYIQLPVVSGKALTGVKFLTGPNASTSVIVDITKTDGTPLNINTSALNKGTEYEWSVGGEVGVAYRIQVMSAHNAQFQYLTLTYE